MKMSGSSAIREEDIQTAIEELAGNLMTLSTMDALSEKNAIKFFKEINQVEKSMDCYSAKLVQFKDSFEKKWSATAEHFSMKSGGDGDEDDATAKDSSMEEEKKLNEIN